MSQSTPNPRPVGGNGTLSTPSPIEMVVCQDGSVFGWTEHSDEWVSLGNAGEKATAAVLALLEAGEGQ